MDSTVIQHKTFCEYIRLSAASSKDSLICDTIQIVERSVNAAISEGATSVEIRYINHYDAVLNPDGMSGTISVEAFREKP